MRPNFTLEFLKTEAASGLILATSALIALIWANSLWSESYFAFLNTKIPIQIGSWSHELSVLKWTKEGLMAVFFFVVGLEIKYEILRGELSSVRKVILPMLGAVGGMVVPALVYLAINANGGDPTGWSIPVATDIAFALAAFAIVGRGLPSSLRVFLLTLAIVDDLGAVMIIALFYTNDIQVNALWGAGAGLAAMALLRFLPGAPRLLYGLLFLVILGFTMDAGVSTSLAGVAAALMVTIDAPNNGEESLLKSFMHELHPYVAYFILPFFAFAASGFSMAGLTFAALLDPRTLGIMMGLFVGKQIGVMALAWVAVKTGLAARPSGATWLELYGVAILCGVGFTMSLFIGGLAFGDADVAAQTAVKMGVVFGSLLSVVWGMVVIKHAARLRKTAGTAVAEAE